MKLGPMSRRRKPVWEVPGTQKMYIRRYVARYSVPGGRGERIDIQSDSLINLKREVKNRHWEQVHITDRWDASGCGFYRPRYTK